MVNIADKTKLNEYINITRGNSTKINLALVTSVQGKTHNFSDYTNHSILTTYLSKEECDKLIQGLRDNGICTAVYFDQIDFIASNSSNQNKYNFIFESSPKGISKGKDALIASYCDMLEIKHAGPDAIVNLILGNKYNWYCILKYNNINVPQTYLFNKCWINAPTTKNKYILKLAESCASIGLNNDSIIENNITRLTDLAINLQKDYKQPIIAQEFIAGYEVEVPVIANDNTINIFPPVGLSLNNNKNLENNFFDYAKIFSDGYGVYNFSEYSPNICNELLKICNQVIKILNLTGYFRIDFRVNNKGVPYIIDINNDPTLGDESSFLYSAKLLGYTKADLIAMIIGNKLSD